MPKSAGTASEGRDVPGDPQRSGSARDVGCNFAPARGLPTRIVECPRDLAALAGARVRARAAKSNPTVVTSPRLLPLSDWTRSELIRKAPIQTFSNCGVESQQLLSPENSASRRVTITRVVIQSGAVNPRHKPESSEQVWIALDGERILLLDEERTGPLVAAPPIDFRAVYENARGKEIAPGRKPLASLSRGWEKS